MTRLADSALYHSHPYHAITDDAHWSIYLYTSPTCKLYVHTTASPKTLGHPYPSPSRPKCTKQKHT